MPTDLVVQLLDLNLRFVRYSTVEPLWHLNVSHVTNV